MRRFLSIIIKNTVFVNVTLFIIIMLGLMGSKNMVRELFPEISVDAVMISIAYPGADPEEVEEGISRKIEEALDGLEGVKKYTTVSTEGIARGIVEIKEGYNIDDIYTDIRNAIDSISTFPKEAEKPIISEIAIKDEIVLLSVWGDQPERVLKELAEDIKDEIQGLPSASQANILGTRDYEISIELSEERLREYGITFEEVASAVRRGSLNLTGGVLRTKGEEIRLRTVGRKYTGEDFANIVVLAGADGDVVTLGQIASIRDAFVEDPIYSSFNGEPGLVIGVFKTPTEDAIAIVNEVKEYVALRQSQLPAGVHLTLWSDRSEEIRGRIALLMRNGLIGLAIVFLSLWLFLEIRLSFWVTMGIPISLSGGLFIMWMVGASLNTISIFGLIMVLGIIVDDAIIVGEAIYVHRKDGDGPMSAAINGVMEVGLPVFAAVATTILAFLPLMFIAGVIGKFVGIIPVAVIAALTTSLIEGLFILPAHLNDLPDLKATAARKPRGLERFRRRINHGMEWFVERVYFPTVSTAVRYRYVTFSGAICVLIIIIGGIKGGFVKFVIFPDSDGNDIVAGIEFPNGTPIAVTDAAVRETERAWHRVIARFEAESGEKLLRNVSAVAGQSGGGIFDRNSGKHLGYVRAELTDSAQRSVRSKDLIVAWERETGLIPGTILQTFRGMEQGPPGAPIDIALKGKDLDLLLAVADEIKAKLRTYAGLYQISDTYRPGKNELRIDLKPEARSLGLTLDDLARQVYAGFYGEEALRIQRGRDDIRVKVRYTEDERSRMAKLEQVRIRTPQGFEVPFFSVADVTFARGYSAITRIDGRKSVSVLAENDPHLANADEVLRDLRETFMGGMEQKYPGFTWSFEGAQTNSREAFAGLATSFPMALVAIFVVIATVFRSYVQPVIIMATIPFGVIGAVLGHYIMGIDLAMFSVFGMVALTGVVVNDAIVMIEAVNSLIAKGVPVMEAISRGGARRFRAIVLTTLSTVGGLSPLILENNSQAAIIIPMAVSIAFGVAFATLLTLFYVPALFAILNDFRRWSHWLIRGRMPTREEVEPARLRHVDPLAQELGEALLVK